MATATVTPISAQALAFPLPIYDMAKIGELVSRDSETFSIYAGANMEIARQIKERSLDEGDLEIQKNTSDRKRFGEGSYETWYKKDRTPFVLLDEQSTLAALVFLGPDPFPKEFETKREKDHVWDTVAARAYAPYRGKGIMSAFFVFVLDAYARMRPGRSLWLVTNADNGAMIGFAKKAGFSELGHRSDGRLVMAKK